MGLLTWEKTSGVLWTVIVFLIVLSIILIIILMGIKPRIEDIVGNINVG
ncbi:MAG: hypothetical protein J7K87_03325 [Candidatus Aenigmarchaeota archaeon]|nr:hypothetical protein [Candidatus Aenigmarchaeota archaeon]